MGQGNGAHDELRALPSVERLAAALPGPRALAVRAARETVAERRAALRAGGPGDGAPGADLHAAAEERLRALRAPSLRRVLNATGVVLHTNLGRAPLAEAARAAVARAAEGYTSLELDLGADPPARGNRQDHVAGLLTELTGAEAALVVNNGAGAVLLSVAALAAGREVIVSRGQLVEIGGGFRIPEVVAASGARLLEVGTTNRTRIEDYARAVRAETGAILRVHPSNFRQLGFVAAVSTRELAALGPPVVDDLGSGALAPEDLPAAARDEPGVRDSVAAGAALACFSGDKLLGGPQAGLLAGRADAIARAAAHPLARALRIDKLSLAALEATLRLHRDPELAAREIPALAMLHAEPAALRARAERLSAAFRGAELVEAVARVGGGTLPLAELPGPVVALDPGLAGELRAGDPPVLGRLSEGRLLLDPRTLTDEEVAWIVASRRP